MIGIAKSLVAVDSVQQVSHTPRLSSRETRRVIIGLGGILGTSSDFSHHRTVLGFAI